MIVAGEGAKVPAIRDRQQARVAPPGLAAAVRDAVARLEPDDLDAEAGRGARLLPGAPGGVELHLALDVEIEHGARRVDHAQALVQQRPVRTLLDEQERLHVERRRRVPVREILRHPGREEQPELSALGAQPEPILAAVGIHVRGQLARREQRAVQPAEAGPIDSRGGAGRDASLQRGAEHQPRRPAGVAEHDRLGVSLQKIQNRRRSWGRGHPRRISIYHLPRDPQRVPHLPRWAPAGDLPTPDAPLERFTIGRCLRKEAVLLSGR